MNNSSKNIAKNSVIKKCVQDIHYRHPSRKLNRKCAFELLKYSGLSI